MPSQHAAFDAFAVERDLRGAAPELLYAPPRTVRRLLRRDRDEPFGWRSMPHAEIAVLDAARLLAIAGDILVVPADIPPRVAVIARPDAARLGQAGDATILHDYWRLAFHALVDLAASEAIAAGRLDVADLVGPTGFVEARDVLVREGRVAADAAAAGIAAEFAATFLELRCFQSDTVADWFPALPDPGGVAAALSQALGAEALLERAMPRGIDPDAEPAPRTSVPGPTRGRTGRWWWPRPRASVLRRRADRTASTGNVVRAMLDEWTAAARQGADAQPSTGRLERLVDSFARRLAWALDLDAADTAAASRVIGRLVRMAEGSPWSPPSRLLYDLQNVCVDSERESFRTQLLRWIGSAGRKPLAVPLPCQRLVLIHRHAVSASARLPAIELPGDDRVLGERLLQLAVDTTATAARETLGPSIAASLSDAGLQASSLVEQTAAEKLVAELLDVIVDRGFVSFGSVRDAISRNQLKLHDLAGPRQWLQGDELLQLDRRLAGTLDGVYRAAPFYLAMLQRLSSPFFGTVVGRLLTAHILLPFGGAWILLRGLEHIVEPVTEYSLGEVWHIYTHARMLAIGCCLWALIHVPAVRIATWQGLRAVAAAIRFLALELPQRILRLALVERLVRSPPVRWFVRHAWSPLVVTLTAWLLLPHHGRWVSRSTVWFPPVFFAASATVLNSAAGRRLQEQAVETAGRLLHRLHVHVIVGLVSWVVDAFRTAMDMVEGTLYAVDESLRFRSDESGLALAIKAVLGAVWSVIEAVVRFCILLLIEPQLNPIKHFPVVTVSHKLLVPMIPVVASQVVATTGMERGLALTVVTFVSTALPGVFGFLAWELKENWRLFAANRSPTLRPVPVGHHGETVRRLLLPGFHSGTVPRLFARLRRLHRSGGTPAAGVAAVRQRHELEHAIAAFFDRNVLALVDRSAAAPLGIVLDDVELAVNRIRLVVRATSLADEPPAVLDLERRDRTIESRVADAGWIATLQGDSSRAVRLAIAGYHRLAAADTATAALAEMPREATTEPPHDGRMVPLDPISWTEWSAAWETLRAGGPHGLPCGRSGPPRAVIPEDRA